MRRAIRGSGATRRDFLCGAAGLPLALPQEPPKPFHVWTLSDPHVFSDLYLRGGELRRLDPDGDLLPHESGVVPRADARESLGDAIRQSESSDGFDWDIAICAGDFSGSNDLPTEREGREVVRQLGRLRRHRREDVYCIAGNHDASRENAWFRKWIDPLGDQSEYSKVNSAKRPFAVEGTSERYSFRAGNILFLMTSDRNDFAPPVGCIVGDRATGGHPPGAVTVETFEWWKQKGLRASWICRAGKLRVTCPKAFELKLLFGATKFDRLNRLKNSDRNLTRDPSRGSGNSLNRPKSAWYSERLRATLQPRLPNGCPGSPTVGSLRRPVQKSCRWVCCRCPTVRPRSSAGSCSRSMIGGSPEVRTPRGLGNRFASC